MTARDSKGRELCTVDTGEHHATRLRGGWELHSYDNEAPTVEVDCTAEITVRCADVVKGRRR